MLRAESIPQMLLFALILMVAIILIALPEVHMVSFTGGAATLVKKRGIISHLNIIEKMAGMNILCSDYARMITNIVLVSKV